jgi:hypothetical protein
VQSDADKLKQQIAFLQQNLPAWAERYCKIRPREGGKIVPFRFNRAQTYTHNFIEAIRAAGHPVRLAVVKGRKQGISTYVAARFLHRCTLFRGVSVFILSHLTKTTGYLFDMVKRMYANLPEVLCPEVERSNRIELKFGRIDSEYALGSAESNEIGRGMTPLLLHCSEVSSYTNTDDLETGLIQGVPYVPGSEIIYESTAKGVHGMFYRLCMQGVQNRNDLSRMQTLFLPWFWQPEYALQPPPGFIVTAEEDQMMETYGINLWQIYWRRRKIEDEFGGDLWKFRQEYPMHLMDAFVTTGECLIKPEYVEAARKLKIEPDPLAPKILGVDGADAGDRTALVLRQGKKILWYKVFTEMKPMRLAGIISTAVDKEDIDMVFLDVAYGYGCRDRLKELGYGPKTQTVHFGEAALEPELYKNKRAQMYGYLRDWFQEGGADIPDDELFCRDLAMIPDLSQSGSKGLLSLPSKITIRKDNSGISPDISDAAALTFAYPVLRRTSVARIHVADIQSSRQASVFATRRRQVIVGEKTTPSELYVR